MIVEALAGGPGVLRRNWLLLFVAPAKYAATMAVLCLIIPAPLALAAAEWWLEANPYVILATASIGLFLAIAASLAVGAVFDAALFGAACDAVNGKPVTIDSLSVWGLARWRRVFSVNAAAFTLFALLFLPFAPSLALYATHNLTAALTAGFAAAVVVSAGALVLSVALMPLLYMAALYDMDLPGYFRLSVAYVKSNLPEALMVCATSALLAQILYAVESVLTGPPQVIPYVGVVISGMLTFLFLALNTATVSALSAVWWVTLLKKKPPKSCNAVSPPFP